MDALARLSRNRRLHAVLALALAAVCFVGVNMAANAWVRSARVDLTEARLFTLSDGTKTILSRLREPITLRLYYSSETAKDFPVIQAYAARVRDLLAEYQAIAGDKLIVEEIDPRPFTAEEDEARAYGLSREATREGEFLYLGLVATNMADGQEIVPFFNPGEEARLEYELTSRIARLDTIERQRLGLITNLPLDTGVEGLSAAMEGQARPFAIYQLLQAAFDMRPLEGNFASIPADVGTLVIAHPRALSEAQLYAIDQFVMRGGKLVVFVDPNSEISRQATRATGEPLQGSTFASDLALLDDWGVAYSTDEVLLDRARAGRVQTADPSRPVADYVLWPHLTGDDFNPNDIVTAGLAESTDSVNLGSAGVLRPADGATTRFEPLITSSDDAMVVDKATLESSLDNPDAATPDRLLARFITSGERYVVAARITGPVKSAFPEGPPPTPEGEGAPPAPAAAPIRETADANIIVVADSDILDDQRWIGQGQDAAGRPVPVEAALNGAFVAGAVEQMMGSPELISLRARDLSNRPFTVVDDIRREADRLYLAQKQEAENKIDQLRAELERIGVRSEGDVATITPQQQADVTRILAEIETARTQLRDIDRKRLDRIDGLSRRLQAVNIAAVPLLLIAVAIAMGVLRRRRRAAAQAS